MDDTTAEVDAETERRSGRPATAPGAARQPPREFDARILLAVLGMTPQVVTETLYASAVLPPPGERFVPTHIHVVTTRTGRDLACDALLSPTHGRFHRFCREYGIDPGRIAFDERSFVVVERDGDALDDITDDAGNTAVADTIVEKVRQFTADDAAVLHASLAGGRKTMGFYLGYAMSLYGRPQDRLSHVLVSPPFESADEFYYPPRQPTTVTIRGRTVDTRDARVIMADIPFVRLRAGLPKSLVDGRTTFSATVSRAQRALDAPRLEIDCNEGRVSAGGERVDLPPARFAFYALMVRRAKAGRKFVNWKTERLAGEYLHELEQVDAAADFDQTAETLKAAVAEWNEAKREGRQRERRKWRLKGWFEPHKTHVNGAITDQLGPALGARYRIVDDGAKPQSYGVRIAPDDITIVSFDPTR